MHTRQIKIGSFPQVEVGVGIWHTECISTQVEVGVGIRHTECSSTQVEVGVEVRVRIRQTKVESSP